MKIFDAFSWIIQYWSILAVAIPVVIGVVLVGYFFGRRFSVPVGVLGSMLVIFLLGRKTERDGQKERAREINEKREQAYEKIDRRNTTVSDVAERLRKHDF